MTLIHMKHYKSKLGVFYFHYIIILNILAAYKYLTNNISN